MAHGDVWFAQISDIHVGRNGINGETARRNLAAALREIAAWSPRPRGILATADLVCAGCRTELAEFAESVRDSVVPIHALPANHDLWGEKDAAAWLEIIGPTRSCLDLGDLRILLFQDIRRTADGGWQARLTGETGEWLEARLGEWPEGRTVVAFHAPIREEAGDFHDVWRGSNAAELLELLRRRQVLAAITGHWHRTGEWNVRGVRMINAGALVGWQWTGIPPYHAFPVRPGYMLYHYHDGRLRAFWRELAWQEQYGRDQAGIVSVGGVAIGGPRPQVCPPHLFSRVSFTAATCSPAGPAQAVEWSIRRGEWRPMQLEYSGLWQEWSAVLDPAALRPGEHILAVRSRRGGRVAAYDAVPFSCGEHRSPPPLAVVPGRERVFELFYLPE